jgi:hypothetical protein
MTFDIRTVTDFVPPNSSVEEREKERLRNAQFYQIMHDGADNKIEKIFHQNSNQTTQPKQVKIPLIADPDHEISQEITFDFNEAIINEVKKNKSRVVRFYDGGDEIRQKYYDKRDGGQDCEDFESGVKSSYIVRTTLFFDQNLDILPEINRSQIYCTGFCFPNFKEDYCKKFFQSEDHNNELKDLLKSAFKLQIYATLEARQQQIDDEEINENVKVPLILNKPYDFIANLTKDKVDKIRALTKQALNELFHDEEITNAINGKIDKVFLFDKPNQDEVGFKSDEKNEADKAFFTCEQDDFGDEIIMHRMPNKDILSLANKYFYDSHSIRIAVPVMKHPTAKDGNGMDSGARSMEESLAMKSGYFFPAYLNKKYNQELGDPEAINFGKFCGNQKSFALIGALPTTPNSDFEDKALQGAVIGGFIGAGLFTTAVACGIVVAPVAVVPVVAFGIVVSTAVAGAILYPKITQLCDQKTNEK